MNDNDMITLTIHGCARCHSEEHHSLTFHRLRYPVELTADVKAMHWAECPETAQPILLIQEPRNV